MSGYPHQRPALGTNRGSMPPSAACSSTTGPFDRSNLPAEAFFDGRHRVIWQAIERLTAARKPPTSSRFSRFRASGDAEEGADWPTNELGQWLRSARSVQTYADAIRDKATQRSLRAALIEGFAGHRRRGLSVRQDRRE